MMAFLDWQFHILLVAGTIIHFLGSSLLCLSNIVYLCGRWIWLGDGFLGLAAVLYCFAGGWQYRLLGSFFLLRALKIASLDLLVGWFVLLDD